MGGRGKEKIAAIAFFLGAVTLGLYAKLGKVAFGVLSLSETKLFCTVWSFACVGGGILSVIGNYGLNMWLNPHFRARAGAEEKRSHHKKLITLLIGLIIYLLVANIMLVGIKNSRMLLAICLVDILLIFISEKNIKLKNKPIKIPKVLYWVPLKKWCPILLA